MGEIPFNISSLPMSVPTDQFVELLYVYLFVFVLIINNLKNKLSWLVSGELFGMRVAKR